MHVDSTSVLDRVYYASDGTQVYVRLPINEILVQVHIVNPIDGAQEAQDLFKEWWYRHDGADAFSRFVAGYARDLELKAMVAQARALAEQNELQRRLLNDLNGRLEKVEDERPATERTLGALSSVQSRLAEEIHLVDRRANQALEMAGDLQLEVERAHSRLDERPA